MLHCKCRTVHIASVVQVILGSMMHTVWSMEYGPVCGAVPLACRCTAFAAMTTVSSGSEYYASYGVSEEYRQHNTCIMTVHVL